MRRISSPSPFWLALALASVADARADAFCEARAPGNLPATIERIAEDPEMRLAFANGGGLANGGVCWWHSRLQRAAWYLADFDPAAPAPTAKEAKRLVRRLVARREVVVVPGFRDLRSFSAAYEKEIQRAMNRWQIRDTLVNQAYLRGLAGSARFRNADRLKRRLDRVYARHAAARERGDVLFLTLQMRGIASHASLVRSMSPTGDGGYRIAMVDSNFPGGTVEYAYRPGDLTLDPANVSVDDYESIPYVGFARDLERIRRALERRCPR